MAIFGNLKENVVVTRGHLLMWRALATIFAGNSLIFAGLRFDGWLELVTVVPGVLFNLIGLVMLVASFPHASTKPKQQG